MFIYKYFLNYSFFYLLKEDKWTKRLHLKTRKLSSVSKVKQSKCFFQVIVQFWFVKEMMNPYALLLSKYAQIIVQAVRFKTSTATMLDNQQTIL